MKTTKLLGIFMFLFILSNIVFALDKDVAYVLRNPSQPNDDFITTLNSLDYDYVLIDDDDASSTDFSRYAFILVGDDNFPNPEDIPINLHNAVIVNSRNVDFDDWGWFSDIRSSFSRQHQIFKRTNHKIVKDFPVLIDVYDPSTSDIKLNSGNTALTGLTTLASLPSEDRQGVIITAKNNTSLLRGKFKGARAVFFGITQTSSWNSNSKEMFKRSLEWVALGDDKDSDGFNEDEDCDDNDPNTYPGATEIPYDGKDQNCDGRDLRDVDRDSFDASIVGGPDCNDNNPNINPNAIEIIDSIDQNCINDQPVLISGINNVNFTEDTEVSSAINLNNFFTDPDGDRLSYSVKNNVSFTPRINSGIVTLAARRNFFGVENVNFVARDNRTTGSLSRDSNTVRVDVLPVNDAPEIGPLSDKTIVETLLFDIRQDGDFIIIDPDGDQFTITYSSPLDTQGKWRPTVGQAGTYRITVTARDSSLSSSQSFNLRVIPKITINEIQILPTQNRFIELYNPSNSTTQITNWKISASDDERLFSTSIPANGFFIIEDLEIELDDIITITDDKNRVIDSVTYGFFNDGNVGDNALPPSFSKSTGRRIDGRDTDVDVNDFIIFNHPTKGLPNSADVSPPLVTLISPSEGQSLDQDDITFRFIVEDDKAADLSCSLFTNTDGTFKSVSSKTVRNNVEDLFLLTSINDGSYLWNVRCSDSVNSAFAQSNISFTLDENDAPLITPIQNITKEETEIVSIEVLASDLDNDQLTYSINDSRFTSDNNRFTWQTTFDDAGVYTFLITVSDGELQSTANVKVTILNKNRAPILIRDIDNIEMQEDAQYQLDLNSYFTDPDGDLLLFSTTEFNNILLENQTIIPNKDFFGSDSGRIIASDSQLSVESNRFDVNIIPVNDAPRINNVSSVIQWNEDTANNNPIDLDNVFFDVENNPLTFDFTQQPNSKIQVSINSQKEVSFSPARDFFGKENITFKASDGQLITEFNMELDVLPINDAPKFIISEEREIEEDSDLSLSLSSLVSDVDNPIEELNFTLFNKTPEVNCQIHNQDLLVSLQKDFFGRGSCSIKVTDSQGASDETLFMFRITPVNDAPEIISTNLIKRVGKPKLSETTQHTLSVEVIDVDSPITYTWLLDGAIIRQNSPSISISISALGEHIVRFTASDGENIVTKKANLIIGDRPLPFMFDGSTSDFSQVTESQLASFSGLTLEIIGHGKIEFLESLDLREVVDFDNYVAIENGVLAIDTDFFSQLKNKNVRITLYNQDISRLPVVFVKDTFTVDKNEITTPCSGIVCKKVRFEGSSLIFETSTAFASFKSGDVTIQDQENLTINFGSNSQKRSNPEADDEEDRSVVDITTLKLTNTLPTIITNLNLEFTPRSPFSENDLQIQIIDIDKEVINPGEEFTVTISGRIPEKLPSITNDFKEGPMEVATVKLTADPGLIRLGKVLMQAENNLEINDIDAKTNDQTQKSLDDGDEIENLSPGDVIELDVEVENKYTENEDIDFDDIELQFECEDDNDIELDDDSEDINSLSSDDTDISSFLIEINEDAEDSTIDCSMIAIGTDQNGALQGQRLDFSLQIEREDHDLEIKDIFLSEEGLQCDSTQVSLSFNVINKGKRDEDESAIEVTSSSLGFQDRRSISLDEDDSENFDYIIPINGQVSKFNTIQIQTFYDTSKSSDIETITLEDLCSERIETKGPIVKEENGVQLVISNPSQSIEPGKLISIPVEITNKGTESDDFTISIINAEEFATPVSPKKLFLNPGQSSLVLLNLKIKDDVISGVYTTTISVKSNSHNLMTENIGIEINNDSLNMNSNTIFLIFIVILVILIAVAVAFKYQ